MLACLGSTFEFSEEDLQANRKGRLTARQAERLRRQRWRTFGSTTRPLMWTTLFTVLVGAGWHHGMTTEHEVSIWEIGAFAAFLLLGLLPWAGTLLKRLLLIFHLSRDLAGQQVRSRVGALCKQAEEDRRTGEHLFAVVAGVRSEVADRETWEQLQEGERYRVHLAPRSEVVLSIEPVVSEGTPSPPR